jgi:ferredoxin
VTRAIVLVERGARFPCRPGQHVLDALAPVHGSVIVAGCHGGGCGVCRIRVLAGAFETRSMNAAHIEPGDAERGIVLACRTYPASDLTIEVLGKRPAPPTRRFVRRVAAPD